jgi:hypothetical protein
MRRLTRIVLVVAVVVIAGRDSSAGEADAGQLAGLIDQHIESRLSGEGLQPAELADDAEFLRRANSTASRRAGAASGTAHLRSSFRFDRAGTGTPPHVGPRL